MTHHLEIALAKGMADGDVTALESTTDEPLRSRIMTSSFRVCVCVWRRHSRMEAPSTLVSSTDLDADALASN